jgi:UDP-perosamine 4-acetyltransferase
MAKQLIIVGGGGHALSVADAAVRLGYELLGYVAPDPASTKGLAARWLGNDAALDTESLRDILLLNGLGSAGPIDRRRALYLALREQGRSFASVIHPHASVSALDVTLGSGLQILARGVISAGANIGENVLINTGAIVEHGCTIADHSHIASGATVCGDCLIGEAVHVGAGATVIQGVEIGFGAVIAAGAVVTRNVEPLTLVAGVPARELRRTDDQELA